MKIRAWLSDTLGSPAQFAMSLAYLTTGSVLCSLSVNGVALPHQFLSGGLTGLALVLHYIWPVLPVSGLYFVLNLPLFLMSWREVSRRFFVHSLIGTAIFSLALKLVDYRLQFEGMVPAAVFGGILLGTGSGLILRSLGSAGGLDILAVMLLRRYSIRLGTTTLASNFLIMASAAWIFSLEMVVYTLLMLFVSSQLLNFVVTGFSQRRTVMVVTRHWDNMRQELLNQAKGATVVDAYGAYSGRPAKLIYTVVSMNELSHIKSLVMRADPEAFLVVSDTLEVRNPRIGNEPHW